MALRRAAATLLLIALSGCGPEPKSESPSPAPAASSPSGTPAQDLAAEIWRRRAIIWKSAETDDQRIAAYSDKLTAAVAALHKAASLYERQRLEALKKGDRTFLVSGIEAYQDAASKFEGHDMDVPDLMECDGDRSPQYLSAAWEAFDNAVTARRRAISRLKEAAEEGGSAFLAASVDANESEIAKDERDMRQALARAKAAARGRNQLEADCVEPVDASSVSQK